MATKVSFDPDVEQNFSYLPQPYRMICKIIEVKLHFI